MNVQEALNRYFELNLDRLHTMTTQPTPSKPTIKVMLRNVYGEEKVYPACGKAEVFVEMLGQKTLTDYQVEMIKKLGFQVEIVTSHKAQYL